MGPRAGWLRALLGADTGEGDGDRTLARAGAGAADRGVVGAGGDPGEGGCSGNEGAGTTLLSVWADAADRKRAGCVGPKRSGHDHGQGAGAAQRTEPPGDAQTDRESAGSRDRTERGRSAHARISGGCTPAAQGVGERRADRPTGFAQLARWGVGRSAARRGGAGDVPQTL